MSSQRIEDSKARYAVKKTKRISPKVEVIEETTRTEDRAALEGRVIETPLVRYKREGTGLGYLGLLEVTSGVGSRSCCSRGKDVVADEESREVLVRRRMMTLRPRLRNELEYGIL